MTTDNTETPCIRGCVWDSMIEGEEPRPKPARENELLCDSCYHRMYHALKMTPDLMANMRLKMIPAAVSNYESERVHTGKDDAPAPLRVDALDASDALFAKLVSWVDALSEELNATVPSIRTWMGYREVQGSRPVSAHAAHDLAAQLTSWFLVRLGDIAASSSAVAFHDDICWGWDKSPGVYKLTGQYGVEPKPLRDADKRECPVCGRKEVFVKPPDSFDPEWAVLCGRCKWVAEPKLYAHYAEMFKSA